jgi:hypothetical protein
MENLKEQQCDPATEATAAPKPSVGGAGVAKTAAGLVLIVVLGLAAGVYGPGVWSRIVHSQGKSPLADPAGQASESNGRFLVVDSGAVAAALLDAVKSDPKLSSLASRPSALGALVGRGVRQAAKQYAASGYIVIDSSAILGAPDALNVTQEVSSAVIKDAHAMAAQVPSIAAVEPQEPASEPAAAQAPDSNSQYGERLP